MVDMRDECDPKGRDLLTVPEAAEYLRCSPEKVRRVVMKNVAYHRVGATIFFRRWELDAYIDAGRVEPPPPRIAHATNRGFAAFQVVCGDTIR
jgi:excisionase family DNA binding protein